MQDAPPASKLTFQVRSHTEDWESALAVISKMDLTGVAQRISIPSYVATGELDRVVAAKGSQLLADAVTGPCVLDIIDGGGHVAMNRAYAWRPTSADWMKAQLR